MKNNLTFLFLLSISLSLFSCKKEKTYKIDETTMEINDFIWKAMNSYYLWKDKVPELADNEFSNQSELNDFLQNYNDSEAFFESLIYDRENVDHWSWVVPDYEELIKYFQGVRTTTGMRIGLVYEHPGSQNIFAFVKYVLPGSDAESKGIVRGNVFRKIGGQRLTVDNYSELLGTETLDIELATWNGNDLVDTGTIVHLLKSQLNENPVFINRIIQQNGKKIGYLMYNGFTQTYNLELNDAIGFFKQQNIDELILDLRYNPGGSVSTMQYLASMITGQFTGQTLLKYQWHPQRQAWMEANYPNSLRRYFVDNTVEGESLNHLHLDKLYVIATSGSASASESLMNCLKPYIDIIHIGTATHGKYTASVTLFDSNDFSGTNVNLNHKWAIQPIVLKVSNAQGVTDFVNGLQPDIDLHEDYKNLGVLGEVTEPLLQRTLQYIDNGSILFKRNTKIFDEIYYLEKPYSDNLLIETSDLTLP